MATYFWPITLPIILAEFCDPYAGRATLKDWKHFPVSRQPSAQAQEVLPLT